ncbi:MAG: hypothetical protein JNM56_22375 [Planctomycetia bacterium]|nr:hypothetical protein [Planctomycetia bacterium]
MARVRTASEVWSRFRDEQDYIERYTRFLRAKSTIHDQQVVELNRILKRVHIEPLPSRSYDRTAEPFSQEEIAALLEAVGRVGPEVYQTILGHEQCLDDVPDFGLSGPAAGYLDQLGEWIDYVLARLPYDPEDQDEEAILRAAEQGYEMTVDEVADEDDRIPPDAIRALILLAIQHAKHIQVRRQVDAMVYAQEQFADLELLARVARPDAEVNVFRQGFLLLMTAFDAAVFDIIRIAFRKKFFQLIGAFGRQEKVPLEMMGEAGSFKAWRDQMIEDQLKKRYVKDLLNLLQALGVVLVDEKQGDRHVQLIELVLRRNVHVHNRGEIDERYLELDPQSKKPKFNLYNLKLGDIARIDSVYLETAHRLCENCVGRLAAWANAD